MWRLEGVSDFGQKYSNGPLIHSSWSRFATYLHCFLLIPKLTFYLFFIFFAKNDNYHIRYRLFLTKETNLYNTAPWQKKVKNRVIGMKQQNGV